MAQHLFSEVVFNLDTRRIESFKLKPWADDFLMLRMEAYYDEFGDLAEGEEGYASALEKADSNTLLGCWNPMPHRGLHTRGFHHVEDALDYGIQVVYWGCILPDTPVWDGTIEQTARNTRIRNAHAAGASLSELAQQYQISPQRVHQILPSS